MQNDTEFYIGWQAEAPPGFARMIRRFLAGLCLLVPALAFLLVHFQQGFPASTFEFGNVTELSGVYRREPVPFLHISGGMDAGGKPVWQNVLLVAPGKFGFEYLDAAQALKDGQEVTLGGALVYYDGKTALEVQSITPLASIHKIKAPSEKQILGTVTLRGEITDPKCMLGVMKPGFGKPHRDCAVRCISGGIPPVLKVANTNGETEYYLVVGPEGEALNDCLTDFVADGVQATGRLEQHGDWLVLFADAGSIRRFNKGALDAGPVCGGM